MQLQGIGHWSPLQFLSVVACCGTPSAPASMVDNVPVHLLPWLMIWWETRVEGVKKLLFCLMMVEIRGEVAPGHLPRPFLHSVRSSPGQYVLKIHFFIESGLNMIQFKIQFKTKSGIFIQKNIHSIESRIFNRIIHSQKMRKIIQNSKIRPKDGFGFLLRPL